MESGVILWLIGTQALILLSEWWADVAYGIDLPDEEDHLLSSAGWSRMAWDSTDSSQPLPGAHWRLNSGLIRCQCSNVLRLTWLIPEPLYHLALAWEKGEANIVCEWETLHSWRLFYCIVIIPILVSQLVTSMCPIYVLNLIIVSIEAAVMCHFKHPSGVFKVFPTEEITAVTEMRASPLRCVRFPSLEQRPRQMR